MPSTQGTQPRTRQRISKAPPLTVPDIHEDAAERKRILNVLAQRRYRQRKRESRRGKQSIRGSSAPSSAGLEDENSEPPPVQAEPTTIAQEHQVPVNLPLAPELPDRNPIQDEGLDPTAAVPGAPFEEPGSSDWLAFGPDGSLLALSPSLPAASNTGPLCPVPEPEYSTGLMSIETASHHSQSSYTFPELSPPVSSFGDLGTSPSDPSDTAPLSTTSNMNPTAATPSLSSEPDPFFPFPDSYHLAVPPLTLLRALFRIAARLNVSGSVWSLSALSPFNLGLGPPPPQLPPAWRPTATQVLVRHHPVLDLLPWPAVRDRAIGVMALGSGETESETGAGTGAGGGGGGGGSGLPKLLEFIYDMEDGAEGVRIWGSDPYDEGNWEVGQVLFERWWFLFDRKVVERSNYWRRQRGAPPLRITAGETT
ncbi:hypothetical protein VTK26DRAFT_8329 [Humicola hyalothermophila]